MARQASDITLLPGLLLLRNVEAFDLTCNFLYTNLRFAICIGCLLGVRVSWAQLPDSDSAIF
jgi:hypothetical protein